MPARRRRPRRGGAGRAPAPRLAARHVRLSGNEGATIAPHLALREATREVHERLHHLAGFANLAAGVIGRDEYAGLLARLLGFHAPLEELLARALAGNAFGLDPQGWRRAHLLRQDLAALGGSPHKVPTLEVPPEMGEARAMGCLYVLEGSTLGGRQLARRLAPELPSRFLTGSAEFNHPRWATIRAALDRCGENSFDLPLMIAGAVHTFGQFEAWFSELSRSSDAGTSK